MDPPVPDLPQSQETEPVPDTASENAEHVQDMKTEEVPAPKPRHKKVPLNEEQRAALREKMRPYHQKRDQERFKKRMEEREAELTKRKVLEKELELQRQRLVELELQEKQNKYRIERLLAAEEVDLSPAESPRPRRGRKPRLEVEHDERARAERAEAMSLQPPQTAKTLTPYEQRMMAIRASLLASLNDD